MRFCQNLRVRMTRSLPVLAALTAAFLLSGCTASVGDLTGGDTAVRDEDSGEVTESGQADVFTLSVGDCLDEQTGEEISDVPLVPCSEPHDMEVFGEITLDDGDWPGVDVVGQQADEGCYAQFEAFVGLPYEESTLLFSSYMPTQQGWEEFDDRLVSCLIMDPAGKTTGSLAGAGI